MRTTLPALACLPLIALGGCARESATPPQEASVDRPEELFVDVSAGVGLDFEHFNGMTGELYIVEMMGPGGALLDYDHDGDLDLLLRQGAPLGEAGGRSSTTKAFSDRLYRNDLSLSPEGEASVRLVDVSAASGLANFGYGIGLATGDYDRDGNVDLYLTNFGSNQLLRNRGDGTFKDVTDATGTDDDRWTAAAAFGDFDRDGELDLFVGNYVDFRITNHRTCRRESSAEDYCGPMSYRPEPDRLFRNLGDGAFEEVTESARLASGLGAALGAVAGDVDDDGWLDLFVANDAMENQLWLNRGDGTFSDEALLRGCAINGQGEREGSMGIAWGDIDVDGDPDILLSHMATETHTLYLNSGDGMFRDGTLVAGLAAPSRRFTGFGTSWIDFENDGLLDLAVMNGDIKMIDELVRQGDLYPLHQTNQLFRNLGSGRFEEVTESAGEAFVLSEVSRGAAFGDIDNDGDTDILIVNNNGPARLLLNSGAGENDWIGLRPADVGTGADRPDCRLEVRGGAESPLVRWSGTDGSYLSAGDPRVVAGLGSTSTGVQVRIRWTGGEVTEIVGLPPGYYVSLLEDPNRAPRSNRRLVP